MEKKCRHCMDTFKPDGNHDKACKYHPESFTGETAQRWLAPGDTVGGGDVHNFWSCCGSSDVKAEGCCYTRHAGFGEPEDITMRKPGMGVVLSESAKQNS
mmetsp:Transcript_988/g.2131  ORF Transcript_988/g.2131 Transcript_988/m.2131 type:complete len:100 (+) Transcript_988:46-345(+)|eukprot:CAMPEP_0114431984 /NCGR_PEP_ID=MMETSP0103-20121206/10907_1 /TAXON_ID=37642 ORGANISM="Paraphysomonas imperforata, Strain PA2" /NCGR_SAMPLE_ID=MMETSP0103 /ASSEMBLY_ACC=CAM_ASM_000201 /LENGTH=99 /DNA_ID=CAMNT_0001601617 /DNA_START=47 /DNA_END=346 /DNA_ORIENTATION=+